MSEILDAVLAANRSYAGTFGERISCLLRHAQTPLNYFPRECRVPI